MNGTLGFPFDDGGTTSTGSVSYGTTFWNTTTFNPRPPQKPLAAITSKTDIIIPSLASGSADLLKQTAQSYHFRIIKIPKFKKVRGKKVQKGVRILHAPCDELKELQNSLIAELCQYGIGVHGAAHAYRRKRSIHTMAAPHVDKKVVLRLDLQDFFSTVTQSMVISRLPKKVPKDLIKMIRNWCFLEGVLPQGAPSSPLLSNVALFGLDQQISSICKTWRYAGNPAKISPKLKLKFYRLGQITYTRYCDDLVFSSNYRFLSHLIPPIRGLVNKYGLKVNDKKVICSKYSGRQYVTGIVVNEKMSCPKEYRKNLRAEMCRTILDTANGKCPTLYKLDIEGAVIPMNAADVDSPFIKLEGQIEFVRSICPEQAAPLLAQFEILKEVHTLAAENWSDGTSAYIDKKNG